MIACINNAEVFGEEKLINNDEDDDVADGDYREDAFKIE